jgi:hypothetical protein
VVGRTKSNSGKRARSLRPKKKVSSRLIEALELMQDRAPGSILWIRNVPTNRSAIAWILVARFGFPGGTTYDEIGAVLSSWESARRVETLIGSQRISRIQVRYTSDRGVSGEYTLSESGPWSLVISRSRQRVLVRDDRRAALVVRYGGDSSRPSDIDALIVWLSAQSIREVIEAPESAITGRETRIRGGGREASERVPEQTPAWSMAIGRSRIGDDTPEESDIDDTFVELPTEDELREREHPELARHLRAQRSRPDPVAKKKRVMRRKRR